MAFWGAANFEVTYSANDQNGTEVVELQQSLLERYSWARVETRQVEEIHRGANGRYDQVDVKGLQGSLCLAGSVGIEVVCGK